VRRSGAFRFSCRRAPLLPPSYPVPPFLRCWPKCGFLGIQLNHCQGAVPRTTGPARLCDRIRQTLDAAPVSGNCGKTVGLSPDARREFYQLVLTLAEQDR
jgi:hypothetical protein